MLLSTLKQLNKLTLVAFTQITDSDMYDLFSIPREQLSRVHITCNDTVSTETAIRILDINPGLQLTFDGCSLIDIFALARYQIENNVI